MLYEFSLRAGKRFPPPLELIDISVICGVSFSKLSYRAMSIIIGLIVFFRDREAVLSLECLFRMGRLIGDTYLSDPSGWIFALKTHQRTRLDQIQEAHDRIYDVEVKALELKCIEEGFIRGFLKGVRLVQRKTGAMIEGLTPSQDSSNSSSNSNGDEVESKLQKTFALE
ncbi:hypothetical protein IEQ34_004863 [Dendrobium chrysotoxum]|uniref:Uncharacterized protein n=1 Tax=Dendrobium chrysotoxum TaxID=161865 RepID=A0AAV7GSB3_DENCH|nr:hypothetical protein IEQ34_004863 [Dendrobium chrysotoxum]